MFGNRARRSIRPLTVARRLSTLASNPHIKVFPHTSRPNAYLLTYLSTEPLDPALAIGTTTSLPPSPSTFRENTRFVSLLYEVLAAHAKDDADLRSQAKAFAGPGGAVFGSGAAAAAAAAAATASAQARRRRGSDGGAGGASAQGGAGGGGVGGWVHLSDGRNPPDFGRIAWPEDILGSVEVDGQGNIVGDFQPSGTYRILTNEGILGLSDFLRERLVARLKAEEFKRT